MLLAIDQPQLVTIKPEKPVTTFVVARNYLVVGSSSLAFVFVLVLLLVSIFPDFIFSTEFSFSLF
jgi:hypothetical protein